jgi:hypothetical protein
LDGPNEISGSENEFKFVSNDFLVAGDIKVKLNKENDNLYSIIIEFDRPAIE